jgi:hypothetical protein
MSARKNRRQNLIDDGVLTDDHLMKLFHHDFMVTMKLLEELIKISLLGQWTDPWRILAACDILANVLRCGQRVAE